MTRKEKVKVELGGALFGIGFLFIGSGMLEAVLLKLLEVVGW